MAQPGFERVLSPREHSFPLPEDQVAHEHEFALEFAARFPEATPLFRAAMIGLHRAAGLPDQGIDGLPTLPEGMEPAESGKARWVLDLMRQPLAANGFIAIELTLPSGRNGKPETGYEQYRAAIESGLHVLENDMPPYGRALLDGLYGLTGTQVLRDDHTTGQPAGAVLLKGNYLGKDIYIAEHFRPIEPSALRHPGVEVQEGFIPYFEGEARALNILHG
jgi:hypothetical protein